MTQRKTRFASVLRFSMTLALLGVGACYDCSQAGCENALHIDVGLPTMTEAVIVEVCRADVCMPPTTVAPNRWVRIDSTLYQLDVSHSGTALSVNATEGYRTEPETGVQWTVTVRDASTAEELAFGSVTPSYTVVYPNGPDCGPVCWEATATIEANPGR